MSFYMKQAGSRLLYSNTGSAISAGDLVLIVTGTSGFVGVAIEAIAATTGTGTVAIGGNDERVWTGPKASGEAFTQGQVLYWDGTQLTGTSSTTFTRVGRAHAAASSSATTADVIINQA